MVYMERIIQSSLSSSLSRTRSASSWISLPRPNWIWVPVPVPVGELDADFGALLAEAEMRAANGRAAGGGTLSTPTAGRGSCLLDTTGSMGIAESIPLYGSDGVETGGCNCCPSVLV